MVCVRSSGLFARGMKMIRLRISSDSGVQDVSLAEEKITIGRSEDNVVRIDAKNISRRHAVIEKTDQGYRVRDLDSRNGIHLNAGRVKSAILSKGDVLKIGPVYIYIEEVPDVQVEPEMELQSVPVEDKEEVRSKIDDVKRLIEVHKRRSTVRRIFSSAAATVFLAVLLAGAVFGTVMILQYKSGDGGLPEPAAAGAEDDGFNNLRSEGLARLNKLRSELRSIEAPTAQHVARAMALQREYSQYFTAVNSGEGKTLHDPFQTLVNEVTARRAAYIDKQYKAARATIDAALASRNYAGALAALEAYYERIGDDHETVTELLQRVNAGARAEFERLRTQMALLRRYKRYAEAARIAEEARSCFRGTPYHADLSNQFEIARLTRNTERALARSGRWNTVQSPAAAGKPAEEAGSQAHARRTPAAPAPGVSLTRLQALFVKAVEDGRLRSLEFSGGRIRLQRAGPEGIESDRGRIAWAQVRESELSKALLGVLKKGDLLALARILHDQGDDASAELALYKLSRAGAKEQVQRILASWRGLASPPEGGYTWNAKLQRWEDPLERGSREALEDIEPVTRRLAKASNAGSIESQFIKAQKIYTRPDITAQAREAIRERLIDALKENKGRRLEEIKKRASRPAGNLSEQARLLEKARKEVLRVMYDTNIYYHEGHPQYEKGLRKYLETCKPLHAIWNGKASASLDPGLRSAVQLVEKINEILSKKLGSPAGQELTGADLEEFVANATAKDARLTIRNYALTRAQRETYEYNDRVDHYNNKVYRLAGGAGPETIEHLNILNAWREEIGRKKLFMDARLQRAAMKHARAQAAAGKIWHVGPDGSPSSRAKAEGFDGPVGENCCIGYPSAQAAFTAWDRASDHCRNQCSDNWNCIGVGHVGRVWVQDLGRTRNIPPGIGP